MIVQWVAAVDPYKIGVILPNLDQSYTSDLLDEKYESKSPVRYPLYIHYKKNGGKGQYEVSH